MSDVDDTLTDVSENVAPSNDYRQTRLKFAIGFCFALFVLQLVGGYISGSLALMADAFHMLSDVLGYAISLMAIRFAVKERSSTYNYGYKRLEVLGALASITLVWILTIGLVMEAIERLQNPEPINGRTMLYMAISGVISLISQDSPKNESKTELAQHTKNDINIRAAMLHAIGDLLCSMGVLTSALIICYFPKMQWVDPLCTFIFAIVAIFTTLSVLKDIGLVLMQVGNPGNIDQSQVKGQLLQIQGVSRVIDVKLWALTMESMVATIELECHSHLQVKDTAIIVKRAKKICSEFGIYETSVQII
ncbi:cation efflux protein [Globomyces pollinis-pini]|nr:cation efflux protein [Globomyces pollinis-pini]